MNHTTSHRALPGARATTAFTDYIAEELHRYDEHLRDIRGLAVGTRSQRARIVGRLLSQKFAEHPVDISKLRPDDVR